WKTRQSNPKNGKNSPWGEPHRFFVRSGAIPVAEAVSSLLKPTPIQVVQTTARGGSASGAARSGGTSGQASGGTGAQASASNPSFPRKSTSPNLPKIAVSSASASVRANGDAAELSWSLSWNPITGAKSYRVEIFTPDGTSLFAKETSQTRLEAKLAKV